MAVLGTVIPAKTPLAVSFYAMNRCTRNWGPDAVQFRPERWLGSDAAKSFGGSRDRFSFSTFSHGPRHCIGQKFAHYEILVFLAGLVGRFHWTFVDQEELPSGEIVPDHDSTVMLKVSGGLRLHAKAIDGW
jgi:cytochrome P450